MTLSPTVLLILYCIAIAGFSLMGGLLPNWVKMTHARTQVAMSLVSGMLTRLQGVLANSFLILVTMIFILMEAVSFPAKVRAVMDDSRSTLESMRRFSENLNQYLAIKHEEMSFRMPKRMLYNKSFHSTLPSCSSWLKK